MTEEKRRVGRRTDAEMEALSLRDRVLPRLELPIRGVQWHEDRTATVTLDEPVSLEAGCIVEFVGPVCTGIVVKVAGPSVMVKLRNDWDRVAVACAAHLIRPVQHVFGVGV